MYDANSFLLSLQGQSRESGNYPNDLMLMPPQRRHMLDMVENNCSISKGTNLTSNNKHANTTEKKPGQKERNRQAAQRWRNKKEDQFYDLEAENDKLREELYLLQLDVVSIKSENKTLEGELVFFQQFMSKIMAAAPDVNKY